MNNIHPCVGLRIGRRLPRWDFNGGFSSRCGRGSSSLYLASSASEGASASVWASGVGVTTSVGVAGTYLGRSSPIGKAVLPISTVVAGTLTSVAGSPTLVGSSAVVGTLALARASPAGASPGSSVWSGRLILVATSISVRALVGGLSRFLSTRNLALVAVIP